MITVVNMIPSNWSDEQNQDCEANLSVNPVNPNEMIATAFTFDNQAGTSALSPAMSGAWAPVFYSTNGGTLWSLQYVLPSGAGANLPTNDVTVRFGGTSGEVYSGLISSVSGSIVINRAPDATTQHVTLVTRSGDQPFVEATTALAGDGSGQDKVYVGYNESGVNATIDQSLDALSASPAGFTAIPLDTRTTGDGPKTRPAIHGNGTIYAAFYSPNADGSWNVVVVKDLNWGGSTPPYQALIDAGDGGVGVRVATSISIAASGTEDADFGSDRRGWELSLAVDPNNDQRVYIVYCSGTGAADYTLHLRQSIDGGATWLADSRTIVKAKNPSVAINMLGDVGFLYQQVVGATGSSNWITVYEHSSNDFTTTDTHTLANVPSSEPGPVAFAIMRTYIGDYTKLLAVGKNFYGVFATGNTPNAANFPSGVQYQRNVNMATSTLLGNDGTTVVNPSIDPFFFSSTAVDPSVDFYVRDWTDSPVSFDTGLEPSTHPLFFVSSDVWNQRSNAAPTFNAATQPNSEDPQIPAMGSNYAFARISRRAVAAGAADVDVTAEFLFADFGLGVPYAAVSATPTTDVTFHAADMLLVTSGVAWQLPATHSQHVCLAAQIQSAADPYQLPSLLGLSPGWPGGSDTAVINDNNKAQRNMGVYPAGQSADSSQAAMQFHAVLHNAATETRDMIVEYAGGAIEEKIARDVTVALYGAKSTTLTAGDVLRIPRMLPGENRWLTIDVDSGGSSSAPSFHDFRELVGGRAVSGFRVVAQPTSTAALIRSNVAFEHALLVRMHALFGHEPPAVIRELLRRLGSKHGDDDDGYVAFVTEHVIRSKYFEVLEAEIDLVPVDVEAHHRRLSGAARRGDTPAVAAAHANLLHQLDALLTMARKSRGDAADILLNLSWQRALYARAPLARPLVDTIRAASMDFIQAFQRREKTTRDFAPFVHALVPEFDRTAHDLGTPGRLLIPRVKRLASNIDDPNAVQKNHRDFLIELQSLI